MSVARRTAMTVAAVGTASAGAGLWLHLGSGRIIPDGFFQYATVAIGTSMLGAFILWHRPRNRYGLTHLMIGMLFGTVVLAAGILSGADGPATLPAWGEQAAVAWSWISAGALLSLWVMAIAAFPDGRFHRRWLGLATIVLSVVMLVLAVVAYLLSPAGESPPLIPMAVPLDLAGPLAGAGSQMLYQLASATASILGAIAPIGAVVALLDRYRKAGSVVRQQIKWLLVGAAISVGLQAIPVHAFDSEAFRTAANVLVVLAVPLPLVAAAIAIFKHGLWEIDVVISKGLVYALASGVLSALFLGISLVAGVSVGGGEARVVGALGLALLVSFFAQPLRQRLEKVVARALYGDEPRGIMALARLGYRVGPAPDAASLGAEIVDVARSALAASWASVWLYLGANGSGSLTPVAASESRTGPSVVVPETVANELRKLSPGGFLFADLSSEIAETLRPLLVEEDAVVASLGSAGKLIGLIACGGRAGEPFGEEDAELLAVLARESALALRNIRLEGELRQRLEQIEHQAEELHDSRQRLVTVQDEERRRIERDLHDGTQQQLVALAARLRRAARGGGATIDLDLERLADEAEEAVFSLQELARGIYPSLLADRGLQAALQAHAARLPVNVRIEVGPLTRGRRFEPELEAALYFVALEAMTNAVKHAPRAHIILSLHADPPSRTVVLEVHDDGPGFKVGTYAAGRGLQNMADRVDAIGGTLSVQSVRGAGTWIHAEVPEGAEVREIRSREETL